MIGRKEKYSTNENAAENRRRIFHGNFMQRSLLCGLSQRFSGTDNKLKIAFEAISLIAPKRFIFKRAIDLRS